MSEKRSAAVGRYEKKQLPFTKKQKRNIQGIRLLIALEIVAIIVLVTLRWFVGGWWITWETSGSSGTGDSQQTTDPNQETVYGDFVAPEFAAEAVTGVPTVPENLGWAVLNVGPTFNVRVCGVLMADADGSLPVWFTADADNTVWVKLRVLDENGNILGETGILKPGQYVERIQLAAGTQSGKVTLQVMGYEPDTYYSAGSVGLATTLMMAD